MSKTDTTAITGWVARDRDGNLYFYDNKPIRDMEDMDFVEQNGDAWFLHEALNLPEITWASDPVEVEITIKKIDK